VRSGETLWSIARSHGVALDALRRANRLAPGQTIRAGQRLAIPGEVSVQERQEPPSPAEIVLGPPPRGVAVAFSWPVAAPTRSGFGPRGDGWHGGIDLAAEPGSPIRVAAPGMVVTSGWERGYGNVVKVWHADDLMTVYAHNRENHVRPGDWVERGQVIGTVGGTGRATAPHLHFEIRLAGRKYDPLFFLPDSGGVDVAASTPAAAGRPR
jgi:murein DD-endopeptidase MepM/ murein hydrolase activator NlpD